MTMPKQATEKCSLELHCPICKNEEHREEDWDGDLQNQPRMHPTKLSTTSAPVTATATATKLPVSPGHRTTSNHLTFQTGILNKLDYERNEKRK